MLKIEKTELCRTGNFVLYKADSCPDTFSITLNSNEALQVFAEVWKNNCPRSNSPLKLGESLMVKTSNVPNSSGLYAPIELSCFVFPHYDIEKNEVPQLEQAKSAA